MIVSAEVKSARRCEAMPRYVILLHQMPADSGRPTHWDLMLEDGETLRTWALQALPEHGTAAQVRMLPDHRPAYLSYEGPVSGNRGSVRRWDHGEFQWVQRNDHTLQIRVLGQRLHGEIRLTCQQTTAEFWRMEYLASGQPTKPRQQQGDRR
jgi:hypothetical protein